MEKRRRVVGLDYPVHNMSIPKQKPTVRERRHISERESGIHEEKIKGLFGYFCAVLLCLSLLLGQGVYINNQGIAIGGLQKNIDSYKLENDKNIIKISNLSSLENIEKVAINEYNMVKAEKIQYLIR